MRVKVDRSFQQLYLFNTVPVSVPEPGSAVGGATIAADRGYRSGIAVDADLESVRTRAGYVTEPDGSMTFMERRLSEQGFLTFMGDKLRGPAVIRSSDDVAWLFKNLESAANEHTFVWAKKRDGSHAVLYLSTGTPRATIVDVSAIAAGLKEMGAVEAVMVHNHPAGILGVSDLDKKIQWRLQSLLEPMGIKCPYGLIINLDSGKYVKFSVNMRGKTITARSVVNDMVASEGVELFEEQVYQFDRQVLYASQKERFKLDVPEDVSRFVSSHKRGTLPKLQALILNNSNEVAKYALLDASKSVEALGADIVADIGKYGTSVVLVSNGALDVLDVMKLRGFCRDVAAVEIMDVLEVRQDRDMVDVYKSWRASTPSNSWDNNWLGGSRVSEMPFVSEGRGSRYLGRVGISGVASQLDLFSALDDLDGSVDGSEDVEPQTITLGGGYGQGGSGGRGAGGDGLAGAEGRGRRSDNGLAGDGLDVEKSSVEGGVGARAEVPSAGVQAVDAGRTVGGNVRLSGEVVPGRVRGDDGVGSGSGAGGGGDTASEVDIHGGGAGGGEQLESLFPSPMRGDKRLIDFRLGDGVEGIGHSRLGGSYRMAEKFAANVEAIRLAKRLEVEGRMAGINEDGVDEQDILIGYTGFGGMSEVFKVPGENETGVARERYDTIRELLTEEEYESVRSSTQNAHYTEPVVARAMWKAVTKMGYTGGLTLDPSMGSGIFYATRPEGIDITMHGVEKDRITALIASKLYPGVRVEQGGFEDSLMLSATYNMAISNVPFGDIRLVDRTGVSGRPSMLKDGDCLIHDFFFMKSLFAVKPGGLVAFVTSHGTLDKVNSSVRAELAEYGDFLGAIRLNNKTFGGIGNTEVVADIVFMQVRNCNKDMSDMTRDEFIEVGTKEFVNNDGEVESVPVSKYFINHPEMVLGKESLMGTMYGGNEYTVEADGRNMAMSLEIALSRLPRDIVNLHGRQEHAEENARAIAYYAKYGKVPIHSYVLDDGRLCQRVEPYIDKDSNYIDHVIEPVRVEGMKVGRGPKYSASQVETGIRIMVGLRDTCREMFECHRRGDTAKRDELLGRLNTLYDDFHIRFGALNVAGKKFFAGEPSVNYVLGLEVGEEVELADGKSEMRYRKADVFKGLTFEVKKYAERVDTPFEALMVSLARYNEIDLDYMSRLLGKPEEEVCSELLAGEYVFRDPEALRRGEVEYVVADAYLSGNVRKKLAVAEKFVEDMGVVEGSAYSDVLNNVRRLNEVVPEYMTAADIKMPINSPLLKEEYVEQFVAEKVLNVRVRELGISHSRSTGAWGFTKKPDSPWLSKKYDAHGTSVLGRGDIRVGAMEIVRRLLNGSPMVYKESEEVYKTDGSKGIKQHLNEELSLDMQARADEIAALWSDWVWGEAEMIRECTKNLSDPSLDEYIKERYQGTLNTITERREYLEQLYNERFNSDIPRTYIHPERVLYLRNEERLLKIVDDDGLSEAERGQAREDLRALRGRGLRIEGCAFPSPLREHQFDAIYRVCQSDATMLALATGSGKSLTMICAAMEMRKLGIRDRIMVVVPNSLMNQFAGQVRMAYPNANILIADEVSWGKDAVQQRKFVAQAVNNDYDMVIVRQSVFERIPCSREFTIEYMNGKIKEAKDELARLRAERMDNGKRDFSVKQIEARRDKLIASLNKRLANLEKRQAGYAGGPVFDDFMAGRPGRFHIFVDEFHNYKNLGFKTSIGSNIKGVGSVEGSDRADTMDMVLELVRRRGGGITVATGTPVTNSLMELLAMMRYLQPEKLREMGVEVPDEFIRVFIGIVQTLEPNNTGSGYKMVPRISTINNVPTLIKAILECWSVMTASRLEELGIITRKKVDADGRVIPGSGELPVVTTKTLTVPSTPLTESYLGYLIEREKALKGQGRGEKGADNVLVIIGDGAKMAVDPRLINEHLSPGGQSKISVGARYLAEHYMDSENTAARKTALVFWDNPRSNVEVFDIDTGKEKKEVLFDGELALREELIALGVKPEHVGCIRDARDLEERQKMFDKLDRGDIRIMIGGRAVMSEGVNAQKHLSLIMNFDLPWTPAKLIQGLARGDRPGNTNDFLEHVFLIRQDSVEVGKLTLLNTKNDFTTNVMSMNWRELPQEVSEEELVYKSLIAMASSDPLLEESARLGDEIHKLELRRERFQKDSLMYSDKQKTLPVELVEAQRRLLALKQDMAERVDEDLLKGDNFSIVVGDKVFAIKKDAVGKVIPETQSARVEAGAAIVDKIKEVAAKAIADKEVNVSAVLGSYGGYRIDVNIWNQGGWPRAYLQAVGRNGVGIVVSSDSLDVNMLSKDGMSMRVHGLVYNRVNFECRLCEGKVVEIENAIVDCKKITGEFPQKQDLAEKKARFVEVTSMLGKSVDEKYGGTQYAFPWESLRSMTPEEIHDAERTLYERYDFFKQNGYVPDDKQAVDDLVDGGRSANMKAIVDSLKQKAAVTPQPGADDLDDDYKDGEDRYIDDDEEFEEEEVAEIEEEPLTDKEISALVELETLGTLTSVREDEVMDIAEMLKSLTERGYIAPALDTGIALTPKGLGVVCEATLEVDWDRAVICDEVVSLASSEAGFDCHVERPVAVDYAAEWQKYKDFVGKYNLARSGEMGDISVNDEFDVNGYADEVSEIGRRYDEIAGLAQRLSGRCTRDVALRLRDVCDNFEEFVAEDCKNYGMVRDWVDRLHDDMSKLRYHLATRFGDAASPGLVRSVEQASQRIEGVYNVRLNADTKDAMNYAVKNGASPGQVYYELGSVLENHLAHSDRGWNLNPKSGYDFEYRKINSGKVTDPQNMNLGNLKVGDYAVKTVNRVDASGDKKVEYAVYRIDEDRPRGVVKLTSPETVVEMKRLVERLVVNKEMEKAVMGMELKYLNSGSQKPDVGDDSGFAF